MEILFALLQSKKIGMESPLERPKTVFNSCKDDWEGYLLFDKLISLSRKTKSRQIASAPYWV